MKHTNKTTLKSLIQNMNRWYGSSWKTSGLVMLGVFVVAVVVPGIVG